MSPHDLSKYNPASRQVFCRIPEVPWYLKPNRLESLSREFEAIQNTPRLIIESMDRAIRQEEERQRRLRQAAESFDHLRRNFLGYHPMVGFGFPQRVPRKRKRKKITAARDSSAEIRGMCAAVRKFGTGQSD